MLYCIATHIHDHEVNVKDIEDHVLLNLLNELRKRGKWIYRFFATSLINSMIQEHNFRFYFHMTLKLHVYF